MGENYALMSGGKYHYTEILFHKIQSNTIWRNCESIICYFILLLDFFQSEMLHSFLHIYLSAVVTLQNHSACKLRCTVIDETTDQKMK